MRIDPLHLRVFLSSPGDVTGERAIARAVVEQLQYDPFVRGRATFEVVAWDQVGGGAPITATETPQAAIDRGLPRPSECDIVVVILWARMGTPLPFPEYRDADGSPYPSGTAWEFEDAACGAEATGRPTVLVYRRDSKALLDLDAPDAEERLRQKRLVNEFFDRMRDPSTGAALRGHKSYESPDGFRADFEHDLRSLVHQTIEAAPGDRSGRRATDGIPPSWEGSPFPGLRAFTPRDAPIFFGRGRETDELVARVTASGFVAVVGASGSGKSSLVGAGLLPRLAQSGLRWALPGYDPASLRWSGLRLTPGEAGEDPFLTIAAKLAPDGNAAALAAALAAAPDRVVDHLPQGTSLVFVDQFEELFTAVDPARVEPWVRLLDTAATSGRCHVVITLRADFYHRCLELPRLARLLESGQLPLGAPSDTLLDMITRPAERADLRFEEGLPGRILRDTTADPDALPLLAYTLDELYRAGSADRRLDHATYERLGGVRGAIGTRAEHVFTNLLDDAARAVFSRVFRELVKVDDRGRATRRRTRLDRITGGEPARRFVDVLTSARLVVRSKDEQNQPIVYVAHEALFGSWHRLATWIQATRDDLLLEHKVTAAAAEWAQHGRDDAFRWPHERLEPVYAMVSRLGVDLDPLTTSFVQPEHERLFPLLGAEEPHRRQNAIDRLVAIGAVTVPGLLELLADESPVVSEAAAAVLGRLGEPAIGGLVTVLDHHHPDVRMAALGALRHIGEPRVVPDLAPLLRDRYRRVRSAAVGVLTALGGPAALDLLGAVAVDDRVDVRWQAAGALGAFGPDAVPHLLAVGDDDEEAYASARRALLAIGERGIEALLAGLRAAEARGRVTAATTLAALGGGAVPGLITALHDADADVRWHACETLSAIEDHRSIPALILALDDADSGVRTAAVHALGALCGSDAVPRLVTVLTDTEHVVRWAAADALARIGGSLLANRLLEVMSTPGSAAPLASAAWIRCAEAGLPWRLSSEPEWVWRRVADAAVNWEAAAVPELLTRLGKGTRRDADGVARALAAIGPAAVRGLVERTKADAPTIRRAAARALGWIGVGDAASVGPLDDPGARRALPVLGRLLEDPDADCRTAAAEALAEFGEDALSEVWPRLSAPRPDVRAAAAAAAALIGALAVPGLLMLTEDAVAGPHATEALRAIGTPAALFGLSELGIAAE